MLDSILGTAPDAVVHAPALLGGKWIADGPSAERVGPFTRSTVSRARVAEPQDARVAAEYAKSGARTVARLAPATRAEVLDRAATGSPTRSPSAPPRPGRSAATFCRSPVGRAVSATPR